MNKIDFPGKCFFVPVNSDEMIIGKRNTGKTVKMIKDTLPFIKEEKKVLAPGGFKLGNYKTVSLTTLAPSQP